MINVDISELEKLTTMLISISSKTDEVFHSLCKINAEIQSDLVLQPFPQYPQIAEAVSLGVNALNHANDTLQSLKNALLYVADEYEKNEKRNKDELAKITMTLVGIETNIKSLIEAKDIAPIEQGGYSLHCAKVVDLVSSSAVDMPIANIASITEIIKDEYGVNEVETIPEAMDGD